MVNSRAKERSTSKTRPVGRPSKKQPQADTESLSQNPTAVARNPVQPSRPKPRAAYRGALGPLSNEVPAAGVPSDADAAGLLMGFASAKTRSASGRRHWQPASGMGVQYQYPEDAEEENRTHDSMDDNYKDDNDLYAEDIELDYISDHSDEQVIPIPIDVPVNGALEHLEVSADISWADFRLQVANTMEIPEAHLDVAYKFSTDTKTDLPRRLSSPANLLQLMSTANQHIQGKVKSRSKKEFIVNLINMSLMRQETKGSSAKGKPTSKKAASVEPQPSSQNPEGQGGGMGMGKFVTALELKYACTLHDKKYCFTKPDEEHRHLTQADIAQWALMISLKQSDFETPPPGLKLFDPVPPRQSQQKRPADTIPEPAALPKPTAAAPPVGAHHQVIPPGPMMYMSNPGMFAPQTYYMDTPTPYLPGPYPAFGREPIFGSRMFPPQPPETPAAAKDPTSFPLLKDWLHDLDNSMTRGADGHNFAQYAPNFQDNHIFRISEIADADTFSRTDLLVICPGIKFGTANVLLSYAREDVKAIQQGRRQFN